MMQKDGILRPQKLANFLQSLNGAHTASRLLPADEPTSSQPQMLVSQTSGLMQPQSTATVLQQLPWIVFGNYLRGEAAVLSHEAQPAAAEEAELLTANVRAAIPGQNGATVVLSSAQSSGQDMLEQVITSVPPVSSELVLYNRWPAITCSLKHSDPGADRDSCAYLQHMSMVISSAGVPICVAASEPHVLRVLILLEPISSLKQPAGCNCSETSGKTLNGLLQLRWERTLARLRMRRMAASRAGRLLRWQVQS